MNSNIIEHDPLLVMQALKKNVLINRQESNLQIFSQ